jgi:hypothetical protein
MCEIARHGLEMMGAAEYARLVSQVSQLAPALTDSPPEDQEMYDAVARLRELNEDFFDLVRRDDLIENYVAPFVLAHSDDFPLTVDDL